MDKPDFFKGMGMGVVLGAAIALTCICKKHEAKEKKGAKCGLGQVVKSIGGIIEDVSEAVGL